jgi:hypothetical protein
LTLARALAGVLERRGDGGLDLAARTGHRPAVHEQRDIARAGAQLAGQRGDLV